MSSKKRVDPKTKAGDVLAELRITKAPIPVDYIAQRRGIRFRYIPLEPDLSGMIFEQSGPTIAINSLHHPNRQRFTFAHEIGHYELHWSEIGSEVHVDKKLLAFARSPESSKGLDRKEIEANSFAAELLVPRYMLMKHIQGLTIDVLDEDVMDDLARHFEVSRQMMSFRIGELLGNPSKY